MSNILPQAQISAQCNSALEQEIDAVWLTALGAKDKAVRNTALNRMVELIAERNGRRTPKQIEALERERGLR